MSRLAYVLGGGGHGRVVLDALLASGAALGGVLDPGLRAGDLLFGVPVLGGDEMLDQLPPGSAELVNGLGANPDVAARRKLFEQMKHQGYAFSRVRHPSAVFGSETGFGEGCQIMAGVVLQNRVVIGDNAVVNTRASLDHDCTIGEHSFIAPGAVLAGDVSVGTAAFIGAAAVILPGVRIGSNSVVGAGAVVTKDVPDGAVFVGRPARRSGRNP